MKRAWLHYRVSIVVPAAWLVVLSLGLASRFALRTDPIGMSLAWGWASAAFAHRDFALLLGNFGLWILYAPPVERAGWPLITLLIAGQTAGVAAQLLIAPATPLLLGGSFLVASAVAAAVVTGAGGPSRRLLGVLILLVELGLVPSQLSGRTTVSHVGHIAAALAGVAVVLISRRRMARTPAPSTILVRPKEAP